MPRLSIWTIRAALIYFGIGFTFGGFMLFNKGKPIDPSLWRLLPIHVEFVLIGWTMQLTMGVAFWILPRLRREERYGNISLARIAFILLNGGICTVAAGEWFENLTRLILVGRGMEFAAVLAFAVYIWPRVKAFGG
jgi:heme/copper-type cytochrome/quinol oxidase subunit 1